MLINLHYKNGTRRCGLIALARSNPIRIVPAAKRITADSTGSYISAVKGLQAIYFPLHSHICMHRGNQKDTGSS